MMEKQLSLDRASLCILITCSPQSHIVSFFFFSTHQPFLQDDCWTVKVHFQFHKHILHCQLIQAVYLDPAAFLILSYDYVKIDSKVQRLQLFFTQQRHHRLFYIPLATYTKEEGQTQISSLFVQQRWFQSKTWMSVERYKHDSYHKAASLLPHRLPLHHKHLNHYCFMVRSTGINAARTRNHEAKDLSSEKGRIFAPQSLLPTVSAAYRRSID